LFVNSALIKMKNRIRSIKLTTRITISNVVLFSLLIALIMYFVSVLTNQFLYFKNREDLTTKQQQIEELLHSESEQINNVPPSERISSIFKKFESYYIFDNYKTLIMIFDTNGQTSYNLNREIYDLLLLDQLKTNPKNLDINVMFKKDIDTGHEVIKFELFQTANSSENVKYLDVSLLVPTKGAIPFVSESNLLGYEVMYTTLRFDAEDGYSAFVSVFLYPELDKDFLLSLNSALLISAAIGILFLSIFGKIFTRKALKPLVDLSQIAQDMDKEMLNYRIPPTNSNDEIDTLIKSLNMMLQNLELSFEYQKRFVSDASHELRIPLTIVLGYIELLKTMGTDNEALLKESLDSIEDEATHMKNLVEKLLILARLENKRLRVNYEWLDLQDFFDKSKLECERLYPNYHFEFDLTYTHTLYSDSELLTQMFRALVENAVKYSPEESTIKFHSHVRNQFIELSLSDEGRGIAKESLGYLTNRFYRLSEDRNRKTGGAGLGLSIVEALIKTLGGHMRIESEIGKGTKVCLFVPHKGSKLS